MSTAKQESPRLIAIGIFLIVVTFIAYFKVLGYEFLNFDDNQYVTENPHITNGFSYEDVVWAFTESYASNWHPITWLSHMLDFEIYGLDPFGHHLTNLIFHALNGILLFFVLIRMTGAIWKSAFVAVLFALHPLNVESVAWIAERKNVLSGFFFFLTIWMYISYSERKQFYGWMLLFFALGLMAKPMLVTLPFLLILLDVWPLKRLGFGEPVSVEPKSSELKSILFIEKIPLFILALGSSVVTYMAQRGGDAVRSTELRSLFSSTANALVSYVEYLQKMAWPRNLSVFYPHPGDAVSVWKALVCGMVLVAITTAVIRGMRSAPYLAVGWFWYLGTLVPVIGLVQVGEQAMADRYTYIPMIGIFICIAWGIPDLLKNRKQMFLPVLGGVFISFLMALTWNQVKYWENSVTLFEHSISINENESPSFVIAYNNLGHALLNENRLEEAVLKFQRAIEINPRYSKPQNNLGNAFSGLKRYDEAIEHYKKAIAVEPGYAEAFNNLANALRQKGNLKESVFYYKEAIRQKEAYDEAHFNLGIVLSQQGKYDEAISQYTKALEINPGFTQAHNNLAGLLAQRGNIEGAVFHYRQAIAIDPGFAKAHNNLGSTLARQGNYIEAIAYFEKALVIDPNYTDARNNLQLARSLAGKQPLN